MSVQTIFSRFLAQLDVPHTAAWSDKAFKNMTFQSLYGFSHLLSEYGVPNKGVKFSDKEALTKLTVPFLAQLNNGVFVIVTQIDKDRGEISYDSRGEHLKISLSDFLKAWNGFALLAFPNAESREPEYASHCFTLALLTLARYLLYLSGAALFGFFFIWNGLYSHISTILLMLFNCAGLYFSWLLVQKSLNIHTAAADKVCGALEKGGCDSIMELKVSKLFGVFSWSEIGFGYFFTSLCVSLLFPAMLPYLALFNVCCLPYTVWSIWYQKFRARHWCTLCVGVQTTLWALFFSYLGGGFFIHAFPLRWSVAILLCAYIFVVLLLNQIISTLKNVPCNENNTRA